VVHRSSLDGIWQSPLTMLLVVLVVLGLIALALYSVLRRRGNAGLQGRVSEYVTLPREQADPAVSKIFTGTERSLERTRWWGRFKSDLEFADIKIPAVQVVVATLVCTLFAMWLFSQILGPLFLLGLGIPLAVRSIIRGRSRRVQRIFADQLPDNLDVLSSALRAGHSLVGALAAVVNNAPDPSRREFQRAVADEQFGVPLPDALTRVAERMNSRDVEQVALVAALQSETGGNAAEVLDRVTDSIRERAELRRLIRVLTAQGRLARWIVSLLPVGLLLLIATLSSSYIKPLFTHTSGRVMLTVAGLMIIAGSVVIGRIVDIEV
jgi:tight adherence protein B